MARDFLHRSLRFVLLATQGDLGTWVGRFEHVRLTALVVIAIPLLTVTPGDHGLHVKVRRCMHVRLTIAAGSLRSGGGSRDILSLSLPLYHINSLFEWYPNKVYPTNHIK